MEKQIRCLTANEIEVRVNQVTDKGVQLLLYKDSRCDKRILDETFGIYGWKNKYEEIKGNLFCTISIWDDEKKQWVEKSDCGTESNNEKEKGEASDAFKRAASNVGVGRELYTKLFYWAKVKTKYNEKTKKYEMENRNEKFFVSEIETNEKTEKIEKVKIVDSNGNVVFSHGYGKSTTGKIIEKEKAEKVETKKTEDVKMIDANQIKIIHTLFSKIEKSEEQIFKNFSNAEAKENVYKTYKISSSKELTYDRATEMIDLLKSKVGE